MCRKVKCMFLNLIDERVILVVNQLAKIFNNEIPHNFIKFMIFSHQKIGIIIILDPLRKLFLLFTPAVIRKKLFRGILRKSSLILFIAAHYGTMFHDLCFKYCNAHSINLSGCLHVVHIPNPNTKSLFSHFISIF